MNQELCLLSPLAIRIINSVPPVSRAHHRPIHSVEGSEVAKPLRESRDSMPIREREGCSATLNCLSSGRQIDQRLLSICISGHSPSVKLEEHGRERAEIERDIVMDHATSAAWDGSKRTLILNANVVNRPVHQSIIRGMERRMHRLSLKIDGQIVQMHEAHDGGWVGNTHCYYFSPI